jgi:hypothetical protein
MVQCHGLNTCSNAGPLSMYPDTKSLPGEASTIQMAGYILKGQKVSPFKNQFQNPEWNFLKIYLGDPQIFQFPPCSRLTVKTGPLWVAIYGANP